MASNNLAVGARALLEAGADLHARTVGRRGETAKSIANEAGAYDVLQVFKEFDLKKWNKIFFLIIYLITFEKR